jgi:hypothetical protein
MIKLIKESLIKYSRKKTVYMCATSSCELMIARKRNQFFAFIALSSQQTAENFLQEQEVSQNDFIFRNVLIESSLSSISWIS